MTHAEAERVSEAGLEGLIILGALFGAAIVVANVAAAVKIDYFGRLGPIELVVPAGTLAYAITFPITDIVDEIYGKRRALYIVWGGLAAEIAMLGLLYFELGVPALEKSMNERIAWIAAPQWRIVAGSITAYLISQHHDVWAFWKWREITRGKWLWVRNNASTMVSQLIDTTAFTIIAFYGLYPTRVVGFMILGQWIFKVGIAALDTPFVYLGVYIFKKMEGLRTTTLDLRGEQPAVTPQGRLGVERG